MRQFNPVLLSCPLFMNIKESDYEPLLTCVNAYTKNIPKNKYLFFSGDTVNYVGIVLSGAVETLKENPAGGNHIIEFLGPANVFAEGIVCTKERRSPVSNRTKEDSQILFIPFERILNTCSNSCAFHMQLIKNMMMFLGEKNNRMTRKIELLLIKGIREKLATYLLNEYEQQKRLEFEITPNRNELAEYLNVSRPSMCRELKRMKELGVIDFYQHFFRIKSLDLLKDCLKVNDSEHRL